MRRSSLGEQVRYRFDNTLARGTIALIGWLALVSTLLIVAIALVVRILGFAPDIPFPQLVWMGLMRTLDAGTMGGDEGGWPFLFAMLAVTLGGVFVISTLIGILSNGLEARIEELRKGRSRVLESNHTIILGWSEHVSVILSELIQANANQRRGCVVVLGQKDMMEMQDEIRERVPAMGNTRVVCRTGNPCEITDLDIASIQDSKSIIILSPPGDDPDAEVIKALLAITHAPNRRPGPYHVVAELQDAKNVAVAKLVGGDELEVVLTSDLIARITAQTCRQAGLSSVYTELLDFAGVEFYFTPAEALVGRSFGEALSLVSDGSVIGIAPAKGPTRVLPPMNRVLAPGDRLIVVAEDDDTAKITPNVQAPIHASAIANGMPQAPRPERTLLLGWNSRAPAILGELDAYVAPGSQLTVVADIPLERMRAAQLRRPLTNQAVAFHEADATDRRTLDQLAVESYEHVIILCYSDDLDAQRADARTLVTLLHLRDIADRCGHPFSITTEMLDIRNRNLAEIAQADDFIVSNRLISLMLSQVSEEKALNEVFADVFDPEGAEIYLKPATDYIQPGMAVTFHTVIEAARQRGEVAFGYRLARLAGDKSATYGVKVNPKKAAMVTFEHGDRVIVFAES